MKDRFYRKLRKEKSSQDSGFVNTGKITRLKEKNYFIIEIPLDGDAPKQYIKAYFYYKNCPRVSKPKKWNKYFAKFGGKSYPHESLIEYSINKIGEYLGLVMNETEIVIANEQIRFLSKDFITKEKKLIHGIEILAEYYEDKQFVIEINKDRKKRREYLTFEEVERAIKHVYKKESDDLLHNLVKMVTFDAILGNNDRHFYNWGVIGNIRKKDSGVVFSPIYDSSRGLLWNKTEDSVKKMYIQSLTDSKIIEGYIQKSKPRMSFEDSPNCNHFDLINYLVKKNDKYRIIVKYLVNLDKQKDILVKMEQELRPFFGKERFSLMKKIIILRFEKLRNFL